MATKIAKATRPTIIHVSIPNNLKDQIRKFRANFDIDSPVSRSYEKAVVYLIERGLETVTTQPVV